MMKNFLILILTTISISMYGQWTSLESGTTQDLYDIEFADDGTGIAVGIAGTIVKTTDGGETWTTISGVAEDLYAVEVVDANTFYVGGNDAWKTTDGGNTWEALGFSYVKRIDFSDALTGYIVDASAMFGTTDGGNTWNEVLDPGGTTVLTSFQNLPNGQKVSFGNIGGYMGYSAYAYRTNDEGEWFDFDVFSFPNSYAFSAACFPTADTGFMFNNQYAGWVPGTVNNLVRMTNFKLMENMAGFLEWQFTSETVNDDMPEYINDAWFATSSLGYAAGEEGSILVTTDGGYTWEARYSGDQAVRAFWFKDADNAYAAGAGGLILKKGQTPPPPPQDEWVTLNSGTSKDLYDIEFIEDGTGVAVGSGGTILKTTDDGATWTLLTGVTDDLYAVEVIDEQTYYVGGNDVWKTTDGGESWEALGFIYAKKIEFEDIMNGHIVDGTGIHQTTDGGENWAMVNDPGGTTNLTTFQQLEDQTQVSFGNIGGYVGYSAYAYKTNDQGEWFDFDVFSFPNSWAFTAAYFPTADTGLMFNNQYAGWVPGPVNNLVRMTNFKLVENMAGYLEWQFASEIINDDMPEYINDAWFADSKLGYAAGEGGSVLTTVDGGISWETRYSGDQAVRAFWFEDADHAFAVGAGGLILKHNTTAPAQPLPPTGLNAMVFAMEVGLNWTAPETNLELLGYNVYRDNQKINDEIITGPGYTDLEASSGTHLYHVTALYSGQESEPSNKVEVVLDGATGKIQGFIRDGQTNLAIEYAAIYAVNTDNGSEAHYTPFGGHYSILLPVGTYDLVCDAEGYEPQTAYGIEVVEGNNTSYTFFLSPEDQITGIENPSAGMVKVYPNPATEKINIEGEGIKSISIYNSHGRLVYTAKGNQHRVNLTQFESGLYIIMMERSDAGVITKEFIVK